MTKTNIRTSTDTFKQAGCITQGQLDSLQKRITSKADHEELAKLQADVLRGAVRVLKVGSTTCVMVALAASMALASAGRDIPRCTVSGGGNGSAPPSGCKEAKPPAPCLQTGTKLCIVVGK